MSRIFCAECDSTGKIEETEVVNGSWYEPTERVVRTTKCKACKGTGISELHCDGASYGQECDGAPAKVIDGMDFCASCTREIVDARQREAARESSYDREPEPPSDAIGRSVMAALDLAQDDFFTRETLPSPAPDDTLRCPASAPPVGE